MIYSVIYFYMTSLCRLFYCIKKGWGQGDTPSKPLFHYVYKPYYIRRQRQPDLRKFVGEGIFCRRRRMVQGRGSTNSSAKANFAFADEWFKVGGRQIRRQRQILPTNGSRSGVGKFVGKGKFCLCRRKVHKFVGKGQFCLCRRMVQGRGSTNSSAKPNFAFADEWFQAEGSREGRGSA